MKPPAAAPPFVGFRQAEEVANGSLRRPFELEIIQVQARAVTPMQQSGQRFAAQGAQVNVLDRVLQRFHHRYTNSTAELTH